ncbi:methyltransferase [Chloroflexales bacterium ZM16-3]|nr:methyltransferase [Chloroflexales bacterium ZM16-3]
MTTPQRPERIGKITVGEAEIPFAVLPGLPELSGDDAMALCARLVAPSASERILLLGCGHGALGVALARAATAGQVTLCDPNLIALRAARRTLELSQVANVEVSEAISLLPELAGQLDRVVILGPQSRALARRWLVEAMALLRPGGALTLAGANRGGVQSLIGDAAALFGAAQILGVGKGCRVAECLRPESPPEPPGWASAPGVAPGTWHSFTARLPAGDRELLSLPGVFSYEHLDEGTDLLLRSLPLPAGARVLDMGCGYGPIGVAAAAAGASSVDMIDVHLLAVAAARANAIRHSVPGEVIASDGLAAVAGRQYDLIVSNPPFHAGGKVDTAATEAFIAGGRALLAPGGRLALVANRFLSYQKMMARHFPRVERIAESKAYHVFVGYA